MVATEEESLEYKQVVNLTNLLKQKSSVIALSFAWFLHFFNDHCLLFVLAMVVANHKTATEADVLRKIVLKYAPDKIVAVGCGKTTDNDAWHRIFEKLIWKTRTFGPPPPYAPIVCRRFEPTFDLK